MQKSAPLNGDMGHANPSERSVCHLVFFFFYIVVTRFMIGHCPPGQPNKKNAYRGFIGKRQMQTWHVPGAVLKISSDRDLKFEF